MENLSGILYHSYAVTDLEVFIFCELTHLHPHFAYLCLLGTYFLAALTWLVLSS